MSPTLRELIEMAFSAINEEVEKLREQLHIANSDKKTLREQLDLSKADAAALRRDFPPAPPLPTVDCTCRTCEFLRERQDRERATVIAPPPAKRIPCDGSQMTYWGCKRCCCPESVANACGDQCGHDLGAPPHSGGSETIGMWKRAFGKA